MDKSSMDSPGSKSAKRPCISPSSPDTAPKTSIGNQIFCNRPLYMKSIKAVGFDMDYTLAQYKVDTFESLVYQQTVQNLVCKYNYPSELLSWVFDSDYMVRGLVIDKKEGNILKMDCYKYVKVAYHGFKELSKEEKLLIYGNTLVSTSYDQPEYALIDTLFSLAEAYLFAQLVEFKDKYPGKFLKPVDYACLYKDVRKAVDLCHRDGTLKQKVAEDPKRYINEDKSIVPMLKGLRESNRATFMVTNSLWDYTCVVMNFICGSSAVNDGTKFDWLQYFDVVITGSAKPNFFKEDNHANLFEVEPESGMLINTNDGSPLLQVGNIIARVSTKDKSSARKVFQGGNVVHLYPLLEIEASSQVLYVGDHIYGDILSSKKTLGWRTMLVIPELDREVQLLRKLKKNCENVRSLRSGCIALEDRLHCLNTNQKSNHDENLKHERDKMRLNYQTSLSELHKQFHPKWGQLMKAGYQNSRFAHQVERYACLYTSQVSNLGLSSQNQYYRPNEDSMQHEYAIMDKVDAN
ncbi:uncharacterized protein [Cicer arietinum]|uniref:Cytosolic purine 5'-nucleotidase-like n=1 Tax=Cicer arietinum TaxID=3827 RepID=A0A1S2XL30_CICAR|nr:cytosolic purine 5'-nucleotidase-like [Cicer arietinum]XP_027187502.1 cytosolic purine 5'-nucleotidase-like [Cicer arietinum]